MSEPVSNAEIEDVLSSIRRLVSESTGETSPDSEGDNTSEKLVLTPAFRVLDRAEAVKKPEEITAHLPEPELEPEQAASSALEQKIAVLEAAIGDSYDEWEPDGSEEQVMDAEPDVLIRATPAHQESAHQESAHQEPASEEEPENAPEAEPAEETGEVLEATFVKVEAAEATREQDTPVAEDVAEDSSYLDEEALRDLVSQLVREELQGHVGERITRSVRRLVRREIQRSLAIRDLE